MVGHDERKVSPTHNSSRTMVERIAEALGSKASAKSVYGEPVERAGVTVIPVAKVRYGFGGGGGHRNENEGEGSGGGGGFKASPIGYIEIKDGTSEFRPIRDPATIARVILVGGLFGFLFVRPMLKKRKRESRSTS